MDNNSVDSFTDVWSSVLNILRSSLTPVAVSTWFSDCSIVDLTDTKMALLVPSDFKRGIIEQRFTGTINDALRELFACDFEIIFLSPADVEHYREGHTGAAAYDGDDFTFENFVVGNSNKFAHAAAKAVAMAQTRDYNPLFIYGDSGLGKTHLLYAIRHEVRKQNPNANIVYVKGDSFTNELVNAIQSGKNAEFHNKYRSADLFLMDDVQFIAGKEFTQEEMFHTFNELHDAGRQIAFTADRPPKEMLRLDDRLRTRFESGLVADIQPPDYETRIAIIRNKSSQLGVLLPEDVIEYIAKNMTSNIRQIEGTVKKIKAHTELMNGEITVSSIESIMTGFLRERRITPEDIVEETAKYFDLSADDIKGRAQTKSVALPRQIAMYEMRKLLASTLQEIAEFFNRDHTTVLASIQKIEDKIAADKAFAQTVRDINSNINSLT